MLTKRLPECCCVAEGSKRNVAARGRLDSRPPDGQQPAAEQDQAGQDQPEPRSIRREPGAGSGLRVSSRRPPTSAEHPRRGDHSAWIGLVVTSVLTSKLDRQLVTCTPKVPSMNRDWDLQTAACSLLRGTLRNQQHSPSALH